MRRVGDGCGVLPKLARGADIPVQSGAATARLQALLNEGPFEMVGSRADMTDRYGRDLRTILRDGRSIADQLREEEVERRYRGIGCRGVERAQTSRIAITGKRSPSRPMSLPPSAKASAAAIEKMMPRMSAVTRPPIPKT